MSPSYYNTLSIDQKRNIYSTFIKELNLFLATDYNGELTQSKIDRLDYITQFINEYESEFNITYAKQKS